MCGIAGILFKHDQDGLSTGKALIDMLDGCQHRGPDSTGFALYGAEHGDDRNNEILTMHMGTRDVLLTLSLDFRSSLTSDQVEAEVTRLEHQIKAAFPEITRIFIEAESRTRGRR